MISLLLNACVAWTLTAELERKIGKIEMRCYIDLLRISYKERIQNNEVRMRTTKTIGPQNYPVTVVERRKLKWYGHATRSSCLSKTVLQGTVEGKQKQGESRKRWVSNIKE